MTESARPGSRAWFDELDARCDAKSWPQPMPRPQGGKAVDTLASGQAASHAKNCARGSKAALAHPA